ncbi:pyruvate kinase [Caldinitratiruptor microaerophilus]|uniref:Pyruvate kinase n=1 Tax=Caldinitratiruptor microaerophilus TaxID=671077 RepID=A0AA35G8H7_9FIRM|nr:pyruvate kinase [Caldinitratiruptor microaerophilus]BDG61025.1 pyruvate kinase [Caldinitratiruptor microaerophilus]
MRRTKIVATIGPASENVDVLVRLIRAGMNVARLNMSHGVLEDHRRRLAAIREAVRITGATVGVMLDLKGPEIRIGTFEGGRVTLREGQPFTLSTRPRPGTAEGVYVEYPGLTEDVRPGRPVYLDDGNIVLEVESVAGPDVHCRVVVGGVLSDRKKVNLPGIRVSLPALAEKDVEDIRFGVAEGVDFIAASFVRKAADVLAIRRVLEEAGGDQQIIAKVESQEGFDNLDEILQIADGLMVARGDLGVEVPTEEVPLMQKAMIERANRFGKPVITATQMLESMVQRPRPTRAEASDVANAIYDGTDAVMLSAETAAGAHPVEAVQTMARIAERTEEALDYAAILARKRRQAGERLATVTEAISHGTVATAADLGAAAIITATASGFTARMVSKYRPRAPIIAVTPNPRVSRQLTLVWGVHPVVKEEATSTDTMMDRAIEGALESGLVRGGDLVVITAGVPLGIQGTTNLIRVETVAEVLARGTGIGRRAVVGVARVVRGPADLDRVGRGDVLVASFTDADFVPAMERAAAVVTEEGGLTSHAAVVCLSLGIPVVVGAQGATARIADGDTVTVDATRGLVYRGKATVR